MTDISGGTMRPLVLTLLLAAATPALADAILDWNEAGAQAITAERIGPPEGARIMAMAHLAQYNAIRAAAGDEGSAEAAASAAARTVLVAAIPARKEQFEKLYQSTRASGGAAAETATAIGERAARECLEMRGKDGVGAPNLYRPVTAPGKYVVTAL